MCIVLAGLWLVVIYLPKGNNTIRVETPARELVSSQNITPLLVVSHPFDLDQIEGISKYRSCFAHNYSGPTVDGQTEDNRSMKHYLIPLESVVKNSQEIPVYAPFDGEIAEISTQEDFGYDVELTPNAGSDKQWRFIFFHILLNQGLEKGSKVSAGQKIGKVKLTPAANFDIGVRQNSPDSSPLVDAPFKYFSPNILADYEKKGVTLENIIVTKAYRDQNPCQIKPGTEGMDAQFPFDMSTQNIIFLRQ